VTDLSPALARGTEGHSQLSADAAVISREELEKDLLAGKDVYLQESRFQAVLDGVPVVGVPDLVHLQGRSCEMVLELKFSKRPDLFIDRFVQAQTYALLLEGNGYATGRALCVVGIVQTPADRDARQTQLDYLRERGVLQDILALCRSLRSRVGDQHGLKNPLTVRHGEVTLQGFPFDPPSAKKHLAWALDYWRNRREPAPTPHGAKCRRCAFNAAGVCPRPQRPPHGGMRVLRRREDGRDAVEVTWTPDP
jgi:hypothetical protein